MKGNEVENNVPSTYPLPFRNLGIKGHEMGKNLKRKRKKNIKNNVLNTFPLAFSKERIK